MTDPDCHIPAVSARVRPHVLRKVFPLLAWMREDTALCRAIAAEPSLAAIAGSRCEAAALPWPACAAAMVFGDDEIDRAAAALDALAVGEPALSAPLLAKLNGTLAYGEGATLGAAWRIAALGANGIIGAYALGAGQAYPGIDSPSYDPAGDLYHAMGAIALKQALAVPECQLFFEPSLAFALGLLGLNRRDEAGRFEPLDEGENRAALMALRAADWDAFPYAALIVHGVGDGTPGRAMSDATIANCAVAAAKFGEGLAPVIVPTGGACHPKQTPFHEAIEMKRSLILVHGIPEQAILIDPHARHTTTNLRNPARLLAQAGAPWGKPCLSISIPAQIDMIASPRFAEFCIEMLDYAPMELGRRLDPQSQEVVLQKSCLLVDPRDPLDP